MGHGLPLFDEGGVVGSAREHLAAPHAARTESVASLARSEQGAPLPATTQARAAQSLHYSFADVRVHAGSEGERMSGALGARAATIGRDLYFAPGEYRPASADGQRLIGHELGHVVQQAGGDAARSALADPQAAADAAGIAVAAGIRSPIGQPAVAFGVPSLQPPTTAQPTTQQQPAQVPTTAAPTGTPASAPRSWDDRARDAQVETDLTRKSAALTALVTEALGTAYTVHEAGTSSPGQLDPADYQAAPTVNFDVRLNSKNKRNGRPVGGVAGHTFGPTGGTQYSILGPLAVRPGNRADVVATADHELYHASHPAAGELESWTDTFVRHFIPTFGNQWAPLIQYYEAETPGPQGDYPQRVATITALDRYYRGLSDVAAPGERNSAKRKFILWFRRRLTSHASTAFVRDLSAKTGITATAPASVPSTPPSTGPRTAPSTP